MTPRLSVVLPVHNGMPFVEQSIASVLAQTFEEFELVIGDDGSVDGTEEVVRRFAASDNRIRHLRRERKSGLARSADWLVREAAAPLVAVAHADDMSHPHRLHWQMRAFDQHEDLQLLGLLWEAIGADGRVVRGAEPWRLKRRSVFAPFPHSSVMLRKQTYLLVNGYRPQAEYWEDLDLYLRMGELGRLGVLADALVTVRHSRASTRLRDEQEQVENAVDAMYRSVQLYLRGEDYSPLISDGAGLAPDRKLDPRTFVACGWTNLLDGRRPGILKQTWRRADLGWNWASAATLGWVVWATLSPRSLRTFVSLVGRARNRWVALALNPRVMIEWRPRDGAAAEAGGVSKGTGGEVPA